MVMPDDGYVTEWKWYGGSESMIRFQVLRDFGEVDRYPNWNQVGHNYTLVGEVGGQTLAAGEENEAFSKIPVQRGDVIGWTCVGGCAFGFSDGDGEVSVRYDGRGVTRRRTNSPGHCYGVGCQHTYTRTELSRKYHLAVQFCADSTPTTTTTPAPPTPDVTVPSSPSLCEEHINFIRAKWALPPMTENTALHGCASREAEFNSRLGAHKKMALCGAASEGEGRSGGDCTYVLDRFYNERWDCETGGAPPLTPHFREQSLDAAACQTACNNDAECLSYAYLSQDGQLSCRFYAEGSPPATPLYDAQGLAWVGPQSQIDDSSADSVDQFDVWTSYTTINTWGEDAFPADGWVHGFKWLGGASNDAGVSFHVFRRQGEGGTFDVVGTVTAAATTLNASNSIDAHIQVQAGDVFGWSYSGAAAFGFQPKGRREILYGNEGEPTSTEAGASFTPVGSAGRHYSVAAAFSPNEQPQAQTPTEHTFEHTYCRAGICNGHCGPLLREGSPSFAWGVDESTGWYTFGWRPNVEIPTYGGECPSGIEVVRCYNESATGTTWVYGNGGRATCHDTCSLAGYNYNSLKCNDEKPIENWSRLSDIMSGFGFPCHVGMCGSGYSWKESQVRIDEETQACYISRNNASYTCSARIRGNNACIHQANLCPCMEGDASYEYR